MLSLIFSVNFGQASNGDKRDELVCISMRASTAAWDTDGQLVGLMERCSTSCATMGKVLTSLCLIFSRTQGG